MFSTFSFLSELSRKLIQGPAQFQFVVYLYLKTIDFTQFQWSILLRITSISLFICPTGNISIYVVFKQPHIHSYCTFLLYIFLKDIIFLWRRLCHTNPRPQCELVWAKAKFHPERLSEKDKCVLVPAQEITVWWIALQGLPSSFDP